MRGYGLSDLDTRHQVSGLSSALADNDPEQKSECPGLGFPCSYMTRVITPFSVSLQFPVGK